MGSGLAERRVSTAVLGQSARTEATQSRDLRVQNLRSDCFTDGQTIFGIQDGLEEVSLNPYFTVRS